MMNLVKLHFSYLFSWKIIYISLVILLVSMISFVVLSYFFYDNNVLVFYSDYYNEEFVFSSLSLMKIVILLQSMFIVINGFVINKYDVYLLIRSNRKNVILSKVIAMLLGISIFTLALFLIMNIIGLFLTPYYEFTNSYYYLLYDLLTFIILYTLLYIILIILVKNMYSLLVIFILYFISNISSEYLVIKSEISWFTKAINLVFPDIGYFSDVGYDLYYSNLYYKII